MLATVRVFQNMKADHLALLTAGCSIVDLRDGAAIFHEGDPADSIMAIVRGDGHVRIGSTDRNSKALMVEVVRAGDIFGEMGVIDGSPRSATAVAQGRVQLARIRASAFQQALQQSPELGVAMSQMLAQRLRRTYQLFQDATFETLEIRLARQILYLLDREGRLTPEGMRLGQRVRQGDLADLLGATTRSIITIMNGWRLAGLVVYDTDRALLTVRNIEAFKAIIHSPSP